MIFSYFERNFKIRIHESSSKGVFDFSGKTLLEICPDSFPFKWNPVVIKADPFLFSFNDTIFLFYEEQVNRNGKGVIKMMQTQDLNQWSEPQAVLKEPFHLSFPYVFKDKEEIFMMPETGNDFSIRLYKSCDKSLKKWELVSKIINDGNCYVDSSIIFKDNLYFLFTTQVKDNDYYQLLYISDTLLSNYREHPMSPLYVGKDYGRNAGSIFMHNNEYFRPSQNCLHDYGKQISVFKITELSKDRYKEVMFKENVIDRKLNFYKKGGHHLNVLQYKNKIILATDAKAYDFNVFNLLKRAFNVIKK